MTHRPRLASYTHFLRVRSLLPITFDSAVSKKKLGTNDIPSGFYDVGTSFTTGDIFLLTFQYFLSLSVSARPSVITISYGSLETDVTSEQAISMCTAAQQLSAAGMTIVVSILFLHDTGVVVSESHAS